MRFALHALALAALAAAPLAHAQAPVTPAERNAILAAAGFKQRGGAWTGESAECEASLAPEDIGDINGDGSPEAVVVENGTYCYGMTGQGIYLLTRTAPGRWTLVFHESGIADFRKTRTNGWPDLMMGGPGFCQPLYHWNGKTYVFWRQEEEERGACGRR